MSSDSPFRGVVPMDSEQGAGEGEGSRSQKMPRYGRDLANDLFATGKASPSVAHASELPKSASGGVIRIRFAC